MIDFKIPIDDAIVNFANHLEANPRTILSSRFGDGKTYFLQNVKDDAEIKEEYKILTIYPVNYQVASNKDIFELLKRDVLFQLMLNEMISGNVTFTYDEAMSWFVQKNGCSIMAELLPYLSEVAMDPESASRVISGMKGLKLFQSLREKFKKFKEEQLSTDDDRIVAFLDKVDSHFVYESDLITKIIQKAIADYKRRTNKKVMLVIEDMDRIDPAHLFRILNVLSAHIDYGYKNGIKPDNSLVGNKFDFDNIVLVVDIKNLHSIYRHFYGQNTSFDGYISKFLSSVPFVYSLEKQKEKYVIKRLVELTNVNEKVLRELLGADRIKSSTIRDIIQSFEIQKQIICKPEISVKGNKVWPDTSVLRLIAVMRRLKMSDEEIREKMLQIKTVNEALFVRAVLPYMFFIAEDENDSLHRSIIVKDEHGKHRKVVELDPKTGTCSYGASYLNYEDNEQLTDYGQIVNIMLEYIA